MTNWADPQDVCITYMSESAGMAQTVLFHIEGVERGTHNLRFQWQNHGGAAALLKETVVEIIVIPDKNLIY